MTWANTQTLEVSDSTKLNATRLSGAAPGGHEIAVTSLARSEQRSYAYTASDSTLTIGSAHVSLSASDDGNAAADKINSNADSPVYAVFVQDPLGDTTKDRLVLTRKDTGASSEADMAVAGAAWTSTEAYTAGVEREVHRRRRRVQQESTQQRRQERRPRPAAHAEEHRAPTSVTVGAPAPDQAAIKTKVKAFVDQYNSTIDFIRVEAHREARPERRRRDTDARKGALFGDPQLTGLLSQLRSAMSDKTGVGGAITSLADIGVSTGTGSGGAGERRLGRRQADARRRQARRRAHRQPHCDVKPFLDGHDEGHRREARRPARPGREGLAPA